MNKTFSIIVPIYNEENNLLPLIEKIKLTFQKHMPSESYEIILVDDGSTDQSSKIMRQIATKYKFVHCLYFIRNFGQTAAWTAGFDHAKGKILITIDADLQNDPDDIPKMYQLMQQKNADIVNGWRQHRKDKFLRSALSKIANLLINKMMNSHIKDSGCSLRLVKKTAIENINFYGEMHRLLPFLLVGYGAKSVQIPVKHYPRHSGVSKYGFSRTFKVVLDLLVIKFLTSYQTKPIYMFGIAGFTQIIFGSLIGFFVFIRGMFFNGDWFSPLFILFVLLISYGFMTIFFGLLAEIQIRTWYESTDKKNYILKK